MAHDVPRTPDAEAPAFTEEDGALGGSLKRLWSRYWFTHPTHWGFLSMGITRWIVYGSVLLTLWKGLPRDYPHFLLLHQFDTYGPDGLLRLFSPFGPPPAEICTGVALLAMLSSLLAWVGLWTRPMMVLSFITSASLLALQYSFRPGASHGYNVVLMAQLAFLFAPAGEAMAVDAWRNTGSFLGVPREESSGRYLWPVYLAQWACGLMFFNAAYWKIVHGQMPWDWVFSDNLRNQLVVRYYLNGIEPPPWVEWFMVERWRYMFLALGNMLGQLLPFLGCLFIHNWRIRLLGGVFFLLEVLGLKAIMGLWEFHWLPLTLLFVDWEQLIPWMAHRASRFPTGFLNVDSRHFVWPSVMIVAFVGYFSLVSLKVLPKSYGLYPFDSFALYCDVRAKQPFSLPQSYEVMASRVVVNSTPTVNIKKWHYQYRNAYKRVELKALNELVTGLHFKVKRKLRGKEPDLVGIRRVVLQSPPYPHHPRPRMVDSGWLGYKKAGGPVVAVSMEPKWDKVHGVSYLDIKTQGLTGLDIQTQPSMAIEAIPDFAGKAIALRGQWVQYSPGHSRLYFKGLPTGRYVFRLTHRGERFLSKDFRWKGH